MRRLLAKLLKDQHGMILSSEVVLVGTILVLGSIVGLASLSYAVNHELTDVANAWQSNTNYGPGSANPDGYTPASGDTYTLTASEGVREVAGY
ncbi:MAG: hypothetical protein KDA91_23175 [Planctomycetaceae bacterium]|nr:hypothetical protein [Planctomycetaceae bacterium]